MKDGKHVILCVDDDQDFLESMTVIISSGDYEIETANSAEEGVRKYKAISPDLVIVDLMMEEVDAGTNFVKEVKALGATIPIYLLSSVGDNLSVNTDYAGLGLTGVFQKPIDPDVLMSTLKRKLK